MQSQSLAALAVFLVAGVCVPVHAEGQFPLKKVEIKGDPPQVATYARQSLEGTRQKPPSVRAAPEVSANSAYYIAKLGDKQAVMLCDLGKEQKLYVDTNMDGDLSNEEPLTTGKTAPRRSMVEILSGSGRSSSSGPARFGPITVSLADGAYPVEFSVEVMHQSSQFSYGYLRAAAYRSGEVEMGGRSYEVNIVDASFDGRYDTALNVKDPFGADWIGVDLNRNGNMQLAMSGPSEVIPLPRMIQAGDAYYGLKVAPDGSSIDVAVVQPEFGAIELQGKDLNVTFWADSGCHVLSSAPEPQRVPAGSYRTMGVLLKRKDDKGATWSCETGSALGRISELQVVAGETLTVAAGEPLLPVVSVTGGRGVAYLGFSLVGQAGEEYAAGAERNGRMQNAPTFKVLAEDGKVLLSAAFEYG